MQSTKDAKQTARSTQHAKHTAHSMQSTQHTAHSMKHMDCQQLMCLHSTSNHFKLILSCIAFELHMRLLEINRQYNRLWQIPNCLAAPTASISQAAVSLQHYWQQQVSRLAAVLVHGQ
jgi:hypothetical protein